jgi:hypothetical protein
MREPSNGITLFNQLTPALSLSLILFFFFSVHGLILMCLKVLDFGGFAINSLYHFIFVLVVAQHKNDFFLFIFNSYFMFIEAGTMKRRSCATSFPSLGAGSAGFLSPPQGLRAIRPRAEADRPSTPT